MKSTGYQGNKGKKVVSIAASKTAVATSRKAASTPAHRAASAPPRKAVSASTSCPGRLAFLFTEDSFRVDNRGSILPEQEETLRDAFLSNPSAALYELAFSQREKGESPSLSFLRFLSGQFHHALTDMPELELARDRAQVELSEESFEKIMAAVPFGNGTEWISKAWIR